MAKAADDPSAPSALLRQLEGSPVCADDFPNRVRLTHAEWALLLEDERAATHQPGLIAIRRVPEFRALADVVFRIGQARYQPAIPVLSRLWQDCALVPVRNAAGHALRAIGTTEARAALEREIEDADHLSVFLALRAIFDADPVEAFDKLRGYFEPDRVRQPGGDAIPSEILATFCPNSFVAGPGGAMKPQWQEPRAPGWLANDRRWLHLCIRLRRDDVLGRVARDALRHADRALVAAALDAARPQEPPRIVAARSAPSGDLVSRYLRGEHQAVWQELSAPEAIDGAFREEVLAVARATMARVARAADVLAGRLAERGWRALSGSLRTPPDRGDEDVMARMEAVTGAPLPPSLRAFWEILGGIDFVWSYGDGQAAPDLGTGIEMDQMDPLAVHSARDLTWLFDEWDDQREGVDPELADPFDLHLAPDYLHKANISGGAPYGIELPFAGADPVFVNEAHGLTFVAYLRLCFRWGGFPRLERYAHEPAVRRFVATMVSGLEPF